MAETATDTVYRALRSANADPDLAHAAAEAVRDIAGQNVVTEIRAEITELRAALDARTSELRGEMAELRGEIGELRGELKAVHHAIASANRINTALVIILGSGVLAILVQVFGVGG